MGHHIDISYLQNVGRKYNYNNTGLFEMIVGGLTTCHTQYTSDRSMCIFYLIGQHSQVFVT